MPKKSLDINENTIPAFATHPGEVLADEIESRNISKSELAKHLKISVFSLDSILQAKKGISPEIAVLLESKLGINAEFWIRMQLNFEKDSLLIKYRNIFEKSKVSSSTKKKFINFLTTFL